jgi:ABC-type cobalamin/Fe3+-siderophores transport system ATPase subunit
LHPVFSFGVEEPRLRFVGRKKELDELKAAVTCDTERIWVIAGPGGIGKSQLMKQFLSEVKNENNSVWLLGESVKTLSSSVDLLFRRLNPIDNVGEGKSFSDPIQGIIEHIRNCSNKRSWIFIIDNVDEDHSAARTVVTALLKNSNVKIFITSRLRHIVGGSGVIVEVKPLSVEDAQSYVYNSLPGNENPELVSGLCETLQNHPLALSQAVDYIRNEQYTSVNENYNINDYLNTFRSQSSKLLKHKVLDESTTVFHTCCISLDIIPKKHKEAGNVSISLLRYLAYFDPNGVHRSVFVRFLSEGTINQQPLLEDGFRILKYLSHSFGLRPIPLSFTVLSNISQSFRSSPCGGQTSTPTSYLKQPNSFFRKRLNIAQYTSSVFIKLTLF